VVSWSEACVCGLSLAGIVGLSPAGAQTSLSLGSVVCYRVGVFASG
jgi:hypothetical protein